MSVIKKINVNGQDYDLAGVGGSSSEPIKTTYLELKALKDSSSLVPNQKYRMTDYVSLFKSDYGYKSAQHPFDLIVTAKTTNSFFEIAEAVLHEGDSYFANNDLSKWVINYSFDNLSSYPVDDSCKGVIYKMIDEFSNEANFDFKNYLFGITAQAVHNIDTEDPSLTVDDKFFYYYLFNRVEGVTPEQLTTPVDASIAGTARNNYVRFSDFSSVGRNNVACILVGIKNIMDNNNATISFNHIDSPTSVIVFSKPIIGYGDITGNTIEKSCEFALKNIAGSVSNNKIMSGGDLLVGAQNWKSESYSHVMGEVSNNIVFPGRQFSSYGEQKNAKKFSANTINTFFARLNVNANIENCVLQGKFSNSFPYEEVASDISYSYVVGDGTNPVKSVPFYNIG